MLRESNPIRSYSTARKKPPDATQGAGDQQKKDIMKKGYSLSMHLVGNSRQTEILIPVKDLEEYGRDTSK